MARDNFYTVEVKPILPVATQIQSNKTDLVFGAGDVLFDWTAFDIPRGAAKLVDIACMMRGAQTTKEIEFFFAKTYKETAPGSIGTGNATANGTSYYKNMLGGIVMDNTNFKTDLDNMTVGTLGYGASADQHSHLVLEGEPNSGTSAGFDRIYVAATVSGGSGYNFSTGILADGAYSSGAGTDITVKTVGAPTFFDIGDVIMIHDSDTAIGTIRDILDNTSILLEANNGVAIADEDEIILQSPITLRLCFER